MTSSLLPILVCDVVGKLKVCVRCIRMLHEVRWLLSETFRLGNEELLYQKYHQAYSGL